MSIPKMTNDLAVIQKLSDLPNSTEGLTSDQLKAKFDEAAQEIQKYINDKLIPAIVAEKIPFLATSEIYADNVDAAIRAVHSQVRDAAAGTIVNGSVTTEKLSAALLARVYGGRPWVSMNTPGSEQNTGADFPIGQIWLRPSFTVVNADNGNWVANGCTVSAGENKFTVTGNNTVVTATATQALTNIGQDGDRVMVLFGIQNKDSEITGLTVSLNSGEAQDASAGVFESTLVGGALTVQIAATWPSTSLAGGSFDVVNYTVVNLDQTIRQTVDAEELTDWAGYLSGLLPLSNYTSPEEVFIQTLNGTWWPMSYSAQPVSRGGTGNNTVNYGELLCGSGSDTLNRIAPPAENGCFLQFVDGAVRWMTADEMASLLGFVRQGTGSYTGTGVAHTVTLPARPSKIRISSGWSSVEIQQGGSSTGYYTGTKLSNGEVEDATYTAGVTLNGTELSFWFNKPWLSPGETWNTGDAIHWNDKNKTYSYTITY